MAMLRRKQTPKRRRIETNLDDDDEIPACATFIDPIPPPTSSDSRNTSEDRAIGPTCPNESAGSKAAMTTASSSASSMTMSSLNQSPSQNHRLARSPNNKNKDDNRLPIPEPHLNTPRPHIVSSLTRKAVAQQQNQSKHAPVTKSSSQKQSVKKQSQQDERQHHPGGHGKTNSLTATNSDELRKSGPITSTPKSKQTTPGNSEKTRMASLKPLAKSMNNQVYLENYTHFNWDVYLELCPAEVAPKEAFMQSTQPPENKFEINMKLEAKDPRGKDVWSVATVIAKEGLRIKLRLDGGDKLNDFYELIDSDSIRPCQSNPHQLLYAPVGYRGDISNYANFVHKIFTNPDTMFATEDIFPPHPSRPKTNLFKPGMKLEAIDDKNPHMICPSTIAQVLNDNRVRIIFDGWPENYALDYPYYSRLLFPVNWCRDTGHQIVPPLRWDKFLEDAQPLVDMNKILSRGASNQNTSINRTSSSTTSARTSRSSNQQQVGTHNNNKNNNTNSNNYKINMNSNNKSKVQHKNDIIKKKLFKKMKKVDKNKTKNVPMVAAKIPIPTTKTTKVSGHNHQQQQRHCNNYQPELLTPQQILQQNKLLRLERKKNDLMKTQLEQTRTKFMTETTKPIDESLLPETSALLNAISSDELSDQSVMNNNNDRTHSNQNSNQKRKLVKPANDDSALDSIGSTMIVDDEDDDEIRCLGSFIKNKPAETHVETPIILSTVNLIAAPVQTSPAIKPN